MTEEEYFEEKCSLCGKGKMIHNDMMTPYDNPGFICKECEEARDRALTELTKRIKKVEVNKNEDC